jgi:hypothetical protein
MFPNDESQTGFLTALLNSSTGCEILGILNPTMAFQIGDIGSVPVCGISDQSAVEIGHTATSAIDLAKGDWDGFERSWEFVASPLLDVEIKQLSESWRKWRNSMSCSVELLSEQERELNRQFANYYGCDSVGIDVASSEVTLTCNPCYRYDEDKSESELEALLLADTMREFISYAVGCMLGRYSLDKPGLILANQGETADDYRQQIPEPTFAPDEDNVIPLLDGDWFEDDITERFKAFLKVTFGTEHYEENLTFLENSLYPDNLTGKKRKTIRDYFLKEFYNHHIKLYKKRPIYWLFSSGKQGAFQALIYMHRYNESTLSRIRTAYVVPLQGLFKSRIDQLENDIPSASSTSHQKRLEKERDSLIKKREELVAFDDTLRHYADQRIEIDLDDGVKENYGKFGTLLSDVKSITGKKPEVIS